MTTGVVIVGAARPPVGKCAGTPATRSVTADEVASAVSCKAALDGSRPVSGADL